MVGPDQVPVNVLISAESEPLRVKVFAPKVNVPLTVEPDWVREIPKDSCIMFGTPNDVFHEPVQLYSEVGVTVGVAVAVGVGVGGGVNLGSTSIEPVTVAKRPQSQHSPGRSGFLMIQYCPSVDTPTTSADSPTSSAPI